MNMTWMAEMLDLMGCDTPPEARVQRAVEHAVVRLGFRYYCFVQEQIPPLSGKKHYWMDNLPAPWKQRYQEADYIHVDPVIAHARLFHGDFIWTDEMFQNVPGLLDDMRRHGIVDGWTTSIHDEPDRISIISLCGFEQALLDECLQSKRQDMRRLAWMMHTLYSKCWRNHVISGLPELVSREIEVLRWTADGKSAQDIADILGISKSTVDNHIRNAARKLETSNKTAAVTRAVFLGLLNRDP